MAKHHPDLVFCRKQPGIALGRLCEKHDGVCVICDSYVRPHVIAHICDECNYGSFEVSCLNFTRTMGYKTDILLNPHAV
jgi:PHD finger-like domain-containing protein 5A